MLLVVANNLIGSFNWFQTGNSQCDGGEPLSIRQMITRVVDDHAIDPSQVFLSPEPSARVPKSGVSLI